MSTEREPPIPLRSRATVPSSLAALAVGVGLLLAAEFLAPFESPLSVILVAGGVVGVAFAYAWVAPATSMSHPRYAPALLRKRLALLTLYLVVSVAWAIVVVGLERAFSAWWVWLLYLPVAAVWVCLFLRGLAELERATCVPRAAAGSSG